MVMEAVTESYEWFFTMQELLSYISSESINFLLESVTKFVRKPTKSYKW